MRAFAIRQKALNSGMTLNGLNLRKLSPVRNALVKKYLRFLSNHLLIQSHSVKVN